MLLRYILGLFVRSLLLFVLGLTFLFIIFDFISNLENFLTIADGNLLRLIIRYYIYKLPFFLSFTLPISVLFASVFSVIRLQKNNELVAIVTSGINLRHLFFVFVPIALFVGLICLFLDEYILPSISDKIFSMEAVLKEKDNVTNEVFIDHTDTETYCFYVGYYSYKSKEMQNVMIIVVCAETGERKSMITADLVKWRKTDGKWWIYDAEIIPYKDGQMQKIIQDGRPTILRYTVGKEGRPIDSKLDPRQQSSRIGSLYQFRTFSEAIKMARKFPEIPAYKVKVYTRIWSPFIALLLFLTGFSYAVRLETKTTAIGIGICFILSVLFYLFYFICLDFGYNNKIHPFFASFLSFFVFGTIGVFSFFKVLRS